MNLISDANSSLTRDTEFPEAQTTARSICEERDVEAGVKEKRQRNSRRHFSYDAPDESSVTEEPGITLMHGEKFETLIAMKYGAMLNFSILLKSCRCKDEALVRTHDI